MTRRAILRLIRPPGMVTADKLALEDEDLLGRSEKDKRKVRGQQISMIMQDPKFSLNPVMRVGKQIMEAYRLHYKVSKKEAKKKTLAMLEAVAIREDMRAMKTTHPCTTHLPESSLQSAAG